MGGKTKMEDGGLKIEWVSIRFAILDHPSSILKLPPTLPYLNDATGFGIIASKNPPPDAPIPRCADSAHRSCRRRDLRNVTAKHSRRSLPYRNRKQKSPAIPVGRRGFLTTRGRRINPSRLLRPWPPATLPRLCWFRWFRFWALLFSRFFSWPWLCLFSFRRSTRPACLFCCT